jgi:hypothetical protein
MMKTKIPALSVVISAFLLAIFLAPRATHAQPPANDNCAGAIGLVDGATFTMNTTNAGTVGDPIPNCGTNTGKRVWFTFTPSGDGAVTIKTCGSAFGTSLEVFSGACDTLTPITCNTGGCGAQSIVSFPGTGGVTYLIMVSGIGNSGGSLRILASLGGPVPSNDLCSGAATLTAGTTFSMNTSNATTAGDPNPTCATNTGKGVWFTFTPSADGPLTVRTCGSNYDTVLQLYTGGCGGLTSVACNDNSCGNQSAITFIAVRGTTYRIFVAGRDNTSGDLKIFIPLLPPNDGCAGALALANGQTFSMSTAAATTDGDGTVSCADNIGKGVWFTYTPPVNGAITVNTLGSNFDTVLQVFTGSCGSLTPVACNDNGNCPNLQSVVNFPGTAGVTYLILAAGVTNSASGTLRIAASVGGPTPTNDLCSGAIALTDAVSFSMSTQDATTSGDPEVSCYNTATAGKGVWFTFTPTDTTTVTVETTGSTFPTVLQVFTGGCSTLTLVACSAPVLGGVCANSQAQLNFEATAGVTYTIFVAGGTPATGGTLTIKATLGGIPPANDACSNAIPLTNGATFTQTTFGATGSGDPATICGEAVDRGVWYSFTPVSDGTVTVSTCGSSYNTALAVFTGACGSLTQIDCNDDVCGIQSSVTFFGTRGTTYRIFVAGIKGARGTLQVRAIYIPTNDRCENAIALNNQSTFTVSTVGATDLGDPTSVCGQTVGKGAWFTFTPTNDGTLIVQICSSDFDTVLQIFSGECGSLTSIACNDDGCGLQSSISVFVSQGIKRIYVGGKNGQAGTVRIWATYIPVNDVCSGALPLVAGATLTVNTLGATSPDDPTSVCARPSGKGVWFTYTPPTNQFIQITTCGSSFDTMLQVYVGNCDSLDPIACNDDSCGLQSVVSFIGQAGVTYRIFGGGFSSASGPLRTLLTVLPGPINDLCEGALGLTNGLTFTMSTGSATTNNDPTLTCNATAGNGVWFTFTPQLDGPVTISTCGSDYDTVIEVFGGSCAGFSTIACNDDDCGTQSRVSFLGFANVPYRILVAGANQARGNLRILAQGPVPPSPDLVVELVSLNLSAYNPNEVATATVTVRNIGGAPTAAGFAVDLFRNALNPVNCGSVATKRVNRPALAAGVSDTFDISFNVTTAPANQTLRVFVDSLCVIAEDSEVNNQATLAYVVKGPDLAVTDVTVTPSIGLPGTAATMSVTIKNLGSLDAGAFRMDSWFALVGAPSCGATGSVTSNFGGLAAGAEITTNYSFTFPAVVGQHEARAFVESQCLIKEIGESNNQRVRRYNVAGPDLAVTNIVVSPTTSNPGGAASVTVTVKNIGTNDVVVPFKLDTWFNLGVTPACGATGSVTEVINGLAVGAERSFTYNFNVPDGAGTYQVRAFADSGCVVGETTESNNHLAQSYTVRGPDLFLSTIALNKTNYTPGELGTVTILIKNIGVAPSGAFKVGLYKDRLPAPPCGLVPDVVVSQASYPVGATVQIAVPFTAPNAAGCFRFRVFVDYECAVAETSEANNSKTVEYSVNNGCSSGAEIQNTGTPSGP